ncbi:LLM class flavin-dependent oxidoreductase [Pyruvatibacter mobilis]|uniref:LLM class flavin-dependent oxidoreductase n=1 Tax=Pyruvatibacter mobilis TaxID=1712261 RepID=UPI003BACBE0B
MPTATRPVEISWFSALCDDDAEFLGTQDPAFLSSFEHCKAIVDAAEAGGFDNILLPSGYSLGIDPVAFAAGVAPTVKKMRLLLAVRCGEMWPPQLARQIATLDQMLGGRLTVNIISSDMPGQTMESAPRYQRTLEAMEIVRTLLDSKPVDIDGEHYQMQLDPMRVGTVSGKCPPFYFGGMSPAAREVAAKAADVFLMWPDTKDKVQALVDDMKKRAAAHGRTLKFGYRVHVIVRETEEEARAHARHIMSKLDAAEGEKLRARALDAASEGVRRQAMMRDAADDDGFVEDNLWTGIGRARSGCGAAIVGNPDQAAAKLEMYREMGFSAFILSGYPHAQEADYFSRLVLPRIDHGPLLDARDT